VWLKLEQRPEEFRAMCQQLAKRLSLAWKRAVDEDEAGALLVGRDADGAPLAPSSSDQPENFS
jgi:hypothetical protein